MPNQRKEGSKLAGAYVPGEQDAALAKIAEDLGFENKAAYLRALFEQAIKDGGLIGPKEKGKPKRKG